MKTATTIDQRVALHRPKPSKTLKTVYEMLKYAGLRDMPYTLAENYRP